MAYIADIVHRNVKLTGTYLGEFARHEVKTSINLLLSEDYLQMRTALMRALAAFPDARRAVAEALHQREAKAAEPPRLIEGDAREVAVDAA